MTIPPRFENQFQQSHHLTLSFSSVDVLAIRADRDDVSHFDTWAWIFEQFDAFGAGSDASQIERRHEGETLLLKASTGLYWVPGKLVPQPDSYRFFGEWGPTFLGLAEHL